MNQCTKHQALATTSLARSTPKASNISTSTSNVCNTGNVECNFKYIKAVLNHISTNNKLQDKVLVEIY